MVKKRVLVSGGSGQLGQSLSAVANDFPRFEMHCLSHSELDITKEQVIREKFSAIKPHFFINTAAYTAVDDAEEKKDIAFDVNRDAVATLAEICEEKSIPLIHFSSDYVYHNQKNRPLKESDPCTPQGVYAKSKREGEKKLQELNSQYLILRASWIYSEYNNNFVKTMYSLLNDREIVQVVNDQIGAPCWSEDLARDTLRILLKAIHVENYIEKHCGIYNYTQLGTASWYDIVIKMEEILKTSTEIKAVETEEFPRPAPRPSYSVMNLNKIRTTFDVSLRHWSKALADCIVRLNR